jgi:WD40 repeat protein
VPGRDLAVIASNAFLYFVNPVKYETPLRLKTGIRTVVAIAASPDGKTVLVGGRPGTIEVYDAAARTKTTTYEFGIGGVHSIAYAPDGLTFAAGATPDWSCATLRGSSPLTPTSSRLQSKHPRPRTTAPVAHRVPTVR